MTKSKKHRTSETMKADEKKKLIVLGIVVAMILFVVFL